MEPSIVSLLPSCTEIVCALGLEKHLVGRSHECDYPPGVQDLPICTAPKFDSNGTSQQIDENVSELVKKGLSVYLVDIDLLQKLNPQFILTQSQCEVCAVSYKEVETAVAKLIDAEPAIIDLRPNWLSDIFNDIIRVSEVLGVYQKGKDRLEQYLNRLDRIKEKICDLDHKPIVVAIEWLEPLMLAGNWVPEIVEMAGGVNAIGKAGKHSHYHQWHEIFDVDPDVITIMPCGFGIQRTLLEMELLTKTPGWGDLKAVREKRVYITDGNHYFNRPGPRIIDSVEIMAEILHPQIFIPSYEKTGYIRYN